MGRHAARTPNTAPLEYLHIHLFEFTQAFWYSLGAPRQARGKAFQEGVQPYTR